MRQTALARDLTIMDLFAGVQEIEIADEGALLEEGTTGSPGSPTPFLPGTNKDVLPPSEMNAFVFFLHSSLWEGLVVWWFGAISAVHSPVSPWSGAKLLPNKTGCLPRAPPSSLQSALVFAPFI